MSGSVDGIAGTSPVAMTVPFLGLPEVEKYSSQATEPVMLPEPTLHTVALNCCWQANEQLPTKESDDLSQSELTCAVADKGRAITAT